MINMLYLFKVTALLFFGLSNVICADDLQCPNNYTIRTTLSKLKKYTFCKYDRLIRPVKTYNDTVDIKVSLLLRRIDFDEEKDLLKIHSYFSMKWYDYHLVWNPADFDNIEYFQMLSYSLWRPDIDVLTTGDPRNSLYYYYTLCLVHSDGEILCVPPVIHQTSCAANLMRWPYDQHTCKMTMGSWTHSGEEINITLQEEPLLLHDYELNREWELISTRAYKEIETFKCCPDETYPTVTFEFVIQRHSGFYTATVIVPIIVLMLITLVTFWMVPGRSDRLFLAAINMFAHFLYSQHLGEILHSNGRDTPLLVTFCRDSLFLTTMALIMAIIGKLLESSKQPVPLWASGISAWILDNRLIQIILLKPQNVKLVNSEESRTDSEALTDFPAIPPTSNWNIIITLLDMICFIIALFVYVILIFGFVP